MIGYGIVGVGGFAAHCVRALEAVEGTGVARLAAAVVRDPARYAAEVARLRGRGCAIYASLEEMLARGRGEVDVVDVPTGIALHVPLATQALEAGYNVLVEKPVAATIQEVLSLREAERRSGRWCAVGYQWIYSPTIQWLRARLQSGRLGAVREARAAIGWPRGDTYYARNRWAGQLRDGEGWVLDGPATNATAHYLTNLVYLAAAQSGAPRIASVRGELYRAREIPSYDTSCIEIELAAGARLLHCASHALDKVLEPRMVILCERATVRWQAPENTAVITYHDGQVERYADDDPAGMHLHLFTQVARVAAGQDPAPLCGLAEGEPQVLAVNLAFESSTGIAPIPARYTSRAAARDGSEVVAVEGMGALLEEALAHGRMFSELGAAWARRTEPVGAEGYVRFPQGQALRLALEG